MAQLKRWLAGRLLLLLNAAQAANDAQDMPIAMPDAPASGLHAARGMRAPSLHNAAGMRGMIASGPLNVRALRHDPGFVALAGGVALALAVSTPATFLVVQPFHHDTLALAVLAVLLIGCAAVTCKLMTLILPEFTRVLDLLTIALLAVEWFSNYAHGLDLFATATLGSTFGSIRAAGYGPLAALIYASIPPLFLFAFLHMAVTRAKRLLYDLAAVEMQRKLAPVREALQLVALMQQELACMHLPALPAATDARMGVPDQPHDALPVRGDAAPMQADAAPHAGYACMKCGAAVAGPQQRAASGRWGCGACKAG